eukprot:CAMPEP_0201564646 /NCGR_PEP_ID=MMETSP0190_2-20130828/3140_1 /ASSEMBLY_ACC=CAM_ASM_000263 /TAXON_ID=37353 /ORGANISM="Rosalina sp." /LENGTH=186 /DNA_ID=CAMNT_0047981109 /DNA_START=54 /DNA_END=610 /DNA_ORIENTATION=-
MVNQRVIDPSKPAHASTSTDPLNRYGNIAPVGKTKPARTGLVERHLPPYAGLRATPTTVQPRQKAKFDASECQDYTGDPPVEYQWNFGDGTPMVKTKTPFIDHAFNKPGSYPVKVTCVDKYGQPATAQVTERVAAPKDVGPPYAELHSHPKETEPQEPVDFDASKSHDYENKPCVKFVWDFGDGSP